MSLYMIICLLLLVVPDLYIWFFFVRTNSHVWLNVAWWIPAAVAVAALCIWFSGHHSNALMRLFFVLLMCLAAPKAAFTLFSAVGMAAGHWSQTAATVLNSVGLAAAAAACCCSIYGLTRGIERIEVREVEVVSENLPEEFDGYRMVQFSDLHIGSFGDDTRFVERLVGLINGLDPDVIVFTGDLINLSPDELEPHLDILAGLRARDGVFSIAGNHDYCIYNRKEGGYEEHLASCKRLISLERSMNWQVLLNRHSIISRGDARIAIVGTEGWGFLLPNRWVNSNLKRGCEGLPENIFTVQLLHDPEFWQFYGKTTPRMIDLTLSGHTHAMQFELFGFSPAAWRYDEWGGLYDFEGRKLYISKGVGGTVPFRFGAWPEVSVITLKRPQP